MFCRMETVFALVALVVGLVIGWFLGNRPVNDWKARHSETDEQRVAAEEKLARMVPELATMSERAERTHALIDELRETRETHGATLAKHQADRQAGERALREEHGAAIEKLRGDNARLADELAALKSGSEAREQALVETYAEREKHFERELARLVEAEEKLQAKFNEIGDRMLAGAQQRFREGAEAHLAQLNKDSLAALEKKVGPVGETLERYRVRVEELEKSRAEAWHQLQGVIGEVKAGQQEVLIGAREITTSIRGGTKMRGDWGEIQFENLLDSCNLRDKTDFAREVGVKDEDGRDQRPDAIINIPGGHKLIVDVKNVFNTYREANEAETEEQRDVLLVKHAKEMRGHVAALSAKRYQDKVSGSADFVVMFVPGEHVLYAALTQDDGLLNYALERGIVLSSPLNFMSIAMTVATMWRQAAVQDNADEIASLGKELYDRLAVVARHMSNLRRDLGKANTSFDQLVGSFDTNLRRTGERFQALPGIDTSAKELHEALPIGHQPRRLANFPDPQEDGREAAE